MAAKDAGKTDKQWHVHLMCYLSDRLRVEEFETLKYVIMMGEEVPQKEIETCTNFHKFWSLLERLDKISVGKYDILIYYLNLLHRQDCVRGIKEYITKIEEYSQRQNRQPGPPRQTDELFEPRYRQMVEEIVHSKFQELYKNQPTLPSSGAAVGPSPLPTKPTRTPRASTRVNKEDKNPARAPQASTRIVRAPASAEINKQDIGGETALRTAAQQGDVRLVKDLLESGADPDFANLIGFTALMYACTEGHKEIVAALIENGADVNIKNKLGKTALMCACIKGHKEVVAALIENGAEVNFKHEFGETALMLACSEGHTEIVAAFIENGADVNYKNEIGWTALMFACEVGHKGVVAALIENGADVNYKNEFCGITALDCANGDNEVVTMLMAAGLNR